MEIMAAVLPASETAVNLERCIGTGWYADVQYALHAQRAGCSCGQHLQTPASSLSGQA
jgi:hypothetical protein